VVAEARRGERSANPDAMDLIFQGIHLQFKGWTPDNLAQARALFVRALALDPDNASALLQLAIVNVSAVGSFMTDDRAALLAEAERDATRALSLAPDFALAHMILGAVYIVTNRDRRMRAGAQARSQPG
jgi:tetratricopeptide (TPR) repeat protein